MKIAFIVLGVWLAFALAWGHVLVMRARRNQDRQLSPSEVWLHTRAAQRWVKTGDLNEAREMLRR